jgi:RHS repeat-associated protein
MTHPLRFVVSTFVIVLTALSSGPQRVAARHQTVQRDGATATLLPDGTVLLLGGERDRQAAAVYDPVTRTTRNVGPLLLPRAWHTATVLPDGSVLIAGGLGADGQIISDVERFIPRSGSFQRVADTAFTPRARHTATLLSDGRVLFAGGDTPSGGGVRAEVWDADANTADVVPGPPSFNRLDGTAQLLPDGRVRISGGREGAQGEIRDSEIFDPALSAFFRDDGNTAVGRSVTVAAVLPGDGATDVSPAVRIALRFAQPVDVRSVAVDMMAIGEASATPVPVTVVTAGEGLLTFVAPHRPLAPATDYRIALRGVRTSRGDAVPPFSSVFRTADVAQTPEPTDTDHAATGQGRGLDSPWRKLPHLKAPSGVTALAGQVLLLNGEPLQGVTLEIGRHRARTDRTGRFLMALGAAASGWEEMLIDGTTANTTGRTYGIFEVAVQIVGKETAPLPYTIWMPTIDTANVVRISSPTASETVITTPRIPGLELHLPANTVVTDHDGRVVREISITPIPVAQPPFPLPAGVEVPVYFTIQPGAAYVATQASAYGRKGAWLVYPNYRNQPVGTEHNFWQYDPEEKGWYVYGLGRVAASGRQVVPNYSTSLYEFTGAMINYGQSPGPPGGNDPKDGDPVDLSTGQFVLTKTDLLIQDVIPLALTRTYYSGDSGQRPFGLGTTHPYAMFLWSANQYQEADLILPDGDRIHYARISGGTGFADAVFENTTSPTEFYKSTIVWNGQGWNLTRKDGMVYVFGENAPLQSFRDRFGNTVTLTWSTTTSFGQGIGNITKVTSPNGRWIAFTYDGSNRITQAKDNIGRTVGYQYDGSGRVWKVTDARGGVTEYTYDIAHRLLTIKDPRSITYLTNEYDVNGRVDRQTQADSGVYDYAYTLNGSLVTQTDVTNPRGYVRRLTFNGDRFMTSDIRALGQSVEQATTYTRLTGSNLVETVTDELNRVTRYTYDTKGNVASVTRLYGTADAVTTSFTYDSTFNLVTSVTDPLNHTTTIAYDTLGRPTSLTDGLNHQTTFTTDATGRVTSVTSPLSKTTTFGYDRGDLASVQTSLGHTTTYLTDVVGRVLSVTDPLGSAMRFDYNAHDQITKIVDPRGGETLFTYDANGSLLTLTDARNKTTTWAYNSMDRIATRTDPLSRQESFTYDVNGNLVTWTDRKGQITSYTYDALDRPSVVGFGTTGTPPTYASTITTTYDGGDRLTQVVDSMAGTITRAYDLLDRPTSEVTPEGTISYTYDSANRRATATVTGQTAVSYTFDNADRLTGVTRGTAAVSIAYDNDDRRTSLTLPNGIVVEYTYDDDSRLTGLAYKQGGSTIGTLTYGYDGSGQRTDVGGTWARTTLPTALSSATYDDANQVSTWASLNLSYDANGSVTSDGTNTYNWNARNELTSITGGSNASFGYDAFGRRRTKTIGGVTAEFLYDGHNPVQELQSGTPTANLLTSVIIDEFFTRTDASGAQNYLTDALGSTIALADGSGTVQTSYTYEPFGKSTRAGTATTSLLEFTGRDVDVGSLHYYRARYYHDSLSRFIREDPIGFRGGYNLYSYVSNSPTMYIDPLGLQAKPSGKCELPPCLDVFLSCLSNWFYPGINTAVEGFAQAAAQLRAIFFHNKAMNHAAAKGLVVPMRSSIMRNLLGNSRWWANVASGPILPLINLNWGIWKCFGAEMSALNAGTCKP